jgi:hypothetical protein
VRAHTGRDSSRGARGPGFGFYRELTRCGKGSGMASGGGQS